MADVRSRDRHRLTQRFKAARDPAERERVDQAIEDSAAKTRRRRETAVPVALIDALPVSARAADILAALEKHQVLILCGETGSGKTTQLPKLLLQAGRGARGMIGHTQPRRLAARSVAERIAGELDTPPGAQVGFATRFDKRVSDATRIKLMTDGIMLAETASDRFLNRYDTIIIDEAHERTLNIDFLLGYLKRLLPERPDLKVIVTSATIDPERFALFFDDAPVINVAGRTYPVTIHYRPPDDDTDLAEAVTTAVRELWHPASGDILVFLPGERDIRDTERYLARALGGEQYAVDILALYARLTRAAQNRIFTPGQARRVVLATNVAETSLTVPGIRYVVDTGLARISRYSARAKVQRLPIEPVSRASCDQRAGRCGRVAPGVCIRLYSQADYANRPAFTDPEIQRTNLASVLLTMANLRLGAIDTFDFIDPPQRRHINDGRNLLIQLDALRDGRITRLGRKLARLPLDPRIARMLLAGDEYGVVDAMRVLAAGLTIQDPRQRPVDAREAADQAQADYNDPRSDFVSRLKLWDAFSAAKREHSGNQLRRWCRTRYLNFMRLREWEDLVRQLRRIGHDMGLTYSPGQRHLAECDRAGLHKAVLTGLLDHIGQLDTKNEYKGARGRRFRIFPGSGLAKRKPKWIVAGELIETRALFAHTVAGVEPAWIEAAGRDWVVREHYSPHWEKRRGHVVARERVKLFGLTLADGRKRDFGRIEPAAARDIFIRDGLVQFAVADNRGRLPAFLRHNKQLVTTIAAREARFRRRDLLVDEATQAVFYATRLPATVCDRNSLRRYIDAHGDHALCFDEDTLLRHAGVDLHDEAYPETLRLGDTPIALRYVFDPGDPADGVTARLPLALLNQISRERAEWLVPGLIEEKYREYLRGLPKTIRRGVVPVPQFARAAAERVVFGAGDPKTALREAIHAMTGVEIPPDAWDGFQPSRHLRLRFALLDDQGAVVATGRDLEGLRAAHGQRAQAELAGPAEGEWTRPGLTAWPEIDLPDSVTLTHAGVRLGATPALLDRGDHVDLELIDDATKASRLHRHGVIRLARLAVVKPTRLIKRDLAGLKHKAVVSLPEPPATAGLPADIQQALANDPETAVVAELVNTIVAGRIGPAIRSHDQFEAILTELRQHMVADAHLLWSPMHTGLERWLALRKRLSKNIGLDWMAAVEDINDQLSHMVHTGYIYASDAPLQHAEHLVRYLRAIEWRIDKLVRDGAAADRRLMAQVTPYWQAYKKHAERAAARGQSPPALLALRWLVEEYRVQVFAQPLGTAQKVSSKRLTAALDAI